MQLEIHIPSSSEHRFLDLILCGISPDKDLAMGLSFELTTRAPQLSSTYLMSLMSSYPFLDLPPHRRDISLPLPVYFKFLLSIIHIRTDF